MVFTIPPSAVFIIGNILLGRLSKDCIQKAKKNVFFHKFNENDDFFILY